MNKNVLTGIAVVAAIVLLGFYAYPKIKAVTQEPPPPPKDASGKPVSARREGM